MNILELYKKPLPQVYHEGIFTYKEQIDGQPSILECMRNGISKEKYNKVMALINIAKAKYLLKEMPDELSNDEIAQTKDMILDKINEYNNIIL